MTAVFLGVACAALLTALYWLLRPRPVAGTRATGFTLGSLALACMSYVPAVSGPLEAVIPHVARLFSNYFALAGATSVLVVIRRLTSDAEESRSGQRRYVRRLALSVAVMTVLFVAEQLTGRSPQLYALYVTVFIGSLAFTVIEFRRQAWEQAAASSKAVQRAGLQVTTVGCVLALVYAAYKIVNSWALGMGLLVGPQGYTCTTPVTPARCALSVATPTAAVGLIALGMTVPALAAPIARRVRRHWERRSLARLEPLWRDMAEVAPDFVYDEGRQAAYEDVDFLLVRRIAEIADGLLELAPYRAAEAQRTARRNLSVRPLRRRSREADVEADVLAAAIRAYEYGESPAATPAPAARTGARSGSLKAETDWLVLLATAYARLPRTPADRAGARS